MLILSETNFFFLVRIVFWRLYSLHCPMICLLGCSYNFGSCWQVGWAAELERRIGNDIHTIFGSFPASQNLGHFTEVLGYGGLIVEHSSVMPL